MTTTTDPEVVSCPRHPSGPDKDCAACNVIANDVLNCPVHPNGSDDCADCKAIVDVWTDYAEAYSRQVSKDGGDPLRWHDGHGPPTN